MSNSARVAVAEVPPGPPVLQTLVAEVYGPDEAARHALAQKVIEIFKHTPGVVLVSVAGWLGAAGILRQPALPTLRAAS